MTLGVNLCELKKEAAVRGLHYCTDAQSLVRWAFVTESVQKLTLVSVLLSFVSMFVCVASFCFILPAGVQWSLAILKVRDDTVGEGSVITATSPSPPLHLSFHVFSSLSFVALGMWTLLNFPLGRWWRRQEGMRGVIPSLLLSSVFPSSFPWGDFGHWELFSHQVPQSMEVKRVVHSHFRPNAWQKCKTVSSSRRSFTVNRN